MNDNTKDKQEPHWRQYKRKGLSEMIPVSDYCSTDLSGLSISNEDALLSDEEFQQGYIARNPKNHNDIWYVAKKYFDDNLEPA